MCAITGSSYETNNKKNINSKSILLISPTDSILLSLSVGQRISSWHESNKNDPFNIVFKFCVIGAVHLILKYVLFFSFIQIDIWYIYCRFLRTDLCMRLYKCNINFINSSYCNMPTLLPCMIMYNVISLNVR